MAVPTMDFDWLLDHASAIAFDPGRPVSMSSGWI